MALALVLIVLVYVFGFGVAAAIYDSGFRDRAAAWVYLWPFALVFLSLMLIGYLPYALTGKFIDASRAAKERARR